MYPIRGGKSTYMGQLANLYRRLLPRVLSSILSAKASQAQLPDISLQSAQASPSPYRVYSSHPAEGKVLFL